MKTVTIKYRSKCARLVAVVFVALLVSSCSWFKGKGESEPQTVGPDGGTFTLDNGITIVVPSGALNEDTSLQVNQVENSSVSSILEQSVMSMRPLVFFEALPDGVQLNEPIEVVVPLPDDVEVKGWPVHLELDMETETFTYASTGLQYDPENREITFILDHFSPHGAGEFSDMEGPTECENPATACRCGNIYVESDHRDYSSEDCQGVSQEITVQFLDCPGQPTDPPDRTTEMTDGCTWVGSLDYLYIMSFEGQELTMDCSDPIPFKVSEQGDIAGRGTMKCVIDDTLIFTDPEAGSIETVWDAIIDVDMSLSGSLDGFELKFDPPKTESATGYFKVTGTVPEVGTVVIADIQLGESTVSGDIGIMGDFTILTFSGPTDADDNSSNIPETTFPLGDGETFVHTQHEEGTTMTLTVTLNLTVGKE